MVRYLKMWRVKNVTHTYADRRTQATTHTHTHVTYVNTYVSFLTRLAAPGLRVVQSSELQVLHTRYRYTYTLA